MAEDVLEKSFPVSGQAVLELSNIRGSVNISVGDGDVIHVLAEKDIKSESADDTTVFMEQRNGGSVIVETRSKSSTGFLSGKKPGKVAYKVSVPPGCLLKLSCVSSSCNLTGKLGDIKLKTVSGPVSLSDFDGFFDVGAVSGDIAVENMKGAVSFNTVSGDLSIKNSDLNSVSGASVSGDSAIQSPLTKGPYKFSSVSGNVRLFLPEGNGCNVKTSSLSGRLRTKSSAHRTQNNWKDKEVKLEGGGPLVRFSSISGDIIIEHSGETSWEDDTSEQPSKSEEPPKKEENMEENPDRIEILSLIESGQISVEEGVERLKSL